MEEQETGTTESVALEGQVVDGGSGEPEATESAITPYRDPVVPAGVEVTSADLEELGLMMPIADPAALRAAFAHRQRVLTSILDPDEDFLYAIKHTDRDGKQRQQLVQKLSRAKELTKNIPGASFSAHPVKSGCMKLAHALGIQCVLQSRTGLPGEPGATYSAATYIATHMRTGRKEEGQGYCDKSERDKAHVIISMADTRAYCHAVLRCAGYSSVGADSLDATDIHEVAVTIAQMPTNEAAQKSRDEKRSLPSTSTAQPSVTKALDGQKSAAPRETATAPSTTAQTQSAPAQQAAAPASSAAPTGDVITTTMAAEISKLMLHKLGSKPAAAKWLLENGGVERSVQIPMGKYSQLKSLLDEMKEP